MTGYSTQKCAGRPLLFYSLIFEIAHCLADNTVQYGVLTININQDVDIHKFVDMVDPLSWEEFMPKGVNKELFKKFVKYYDPDVFIKAGRIIRRKTKELDKLDPIDRAEKLALIFGTFRNPDKETVLTPWRVINMHLGKTIGGYNFYDERATNIQLREAKRSEHGVKRNILIKSLIPMHIF